MSRRQGSLKILYLASARLPTEKAHGFQIMKMCEAFSGFAEVRLIHPIRHQPPDMRNVDIWDFFGLKPTFTVTSLRNVDVVRAENVLPAGLFRGVFFLHSLLWGLYVALHAQKVKAHVNYTRDLSIAFWLTRMGLPTVLEAHSVPARARVWLLRRIGSTPSLLRVAALTSYIGDRIATLGVRPDKIAIVPDAVDLKTFADVPDRPVCRGQLGLSKKAFIVGYIGRFHTIGREKGIADLIRALSWLKNRNGGSPNLLCVGGPMHMISAYQELARNEGVPEEHLKFLDRVPHSKIPYWIRSCDVVTIPFPQEEHFSYFTSPLKLFEYMAAEVPIVASRLPSLQEILIDERNALLVEPENPEMLARALARLQSDSELAKRLASQARKDVAAHTWELRAKDVLEGLPS